jgi:hypothetical protein
MPKPAIVKVSSGVRRLVDRPQYSGNRNTIAATIASRENNA